MDPDDIIDADDYSNHPLSHLFQSLGNLSQPTFPVPPTAELVCQARNNLIIEALWHQQRINRIISDVSQLPSLFQNKSFLRKRGSPLLDASDPSDDASSAASSDDSALPNPAPPTSHAPPTLDKLIWPDGDMEFTMPNSNIKATGVPHFGWWLGQMWKKRGIERKFQGICWSIPAMDDKLPVTN